LAGGQTVADQAITGLVVAHTTPMQAGSSITFTASIGQGTGVSYLWNFDDGTSPLSNGAQVSHVYNITGTYTTVVTATNSVSTDHAATTFTVVP